MGVYSKLKIFRYPEKLDTLTATSPDIAAPLHVRIKPINSCNHNCSYCAYRNDDLQLGSNMDVRDSIPRDKMMEIIDDLIEMKVRAVTFSGGGEPLLYPHIVETVEKLAASDIRFASLTNGALLQGAISELFARHGTWLRVSMDGWDDASYSAYRGVQDGEYTRIMRNMESFKSLGGKCWLGVCINVDNRNYTHVYRQLSRLKDAGVDSVKVASCIVSNSGEENNRYHAPLFSEVREQLDKAREELRSDNFNVYDSYHKLDEAFDKSYDWCPYMQILTVVGADCGVYTCQDKAYNPGGLLGSVAERRFKDLWFEKKERFFSVRPKEHCQHHCVANSKNEMIHEFLHSDDEHGLFV